MKIKTSPLFLLASAAICHGATVSNWQVMSALAGTASSTSGLNTNSPVFGDGTANDMDGVGLAGLFGTAATPASVTLGIGGTLTVTARVTLTGGLSTGAGGGYRFSVQNDAGQFSVPSANNWGGGWNHILDTGNTTNDGFYRAGTDVHFMSAFGNASQLADQSSPGFSTSGSFNGDSTSTYLWTMSITRDSATTVDLFSSFVGGDGNFSESYTLNDVSPTIFTYNAVGIQTTATTDLDQLSLSDVQYTYSVIPEPSAALLGGFGLLAMLRRRRPAAR